MLRHALTIAILLGGTASAQQQQASPAQTPAKPQVKINVINVCTPGKDDQDVINLALAVVPAKPSFSTDFEISRGHTTLKDQPDARYVRLRRDYVSESPLMTAQYSISSDSDNTVEILVLRVRDPKEFHEIAIEDRVSSASATPVTVLSTDTPVSRVRIERLGKSSAGLARCQEIDQSLYDPIFRRASEIMAQYRAAMGLRTTFRSDVAWLTASPSGTAHKKQTAKKP